MDEERCEDVQLEQQTYVGKFCQLCEGAADKKKDTKKDTKKYTKKDTKKDKKKDEKKKSGKKEEL